MWSIIILCFADHGDSYDYHTGHHKGHHNAVGHKGSKGYHDDKSFKKSHHGDYGKNHDSVWNFVH